MNDNALIEVQQLTKTTRHRGRDVTLLDRIDLAVAAGDFVSIVGPSGSGKTTLLNVLGMLDHDWTGRFALAGHRIDTVRMAARQKIARETIGFVFQHYHLLDDLNVSENLELPLTYRDVGRRERARLVAAMLERFEIEDKHDLYPSQLSGGQQQMVAVARAVIGRPRLILADEPTGALHSNQGAMIMDLLSELNRDGLTILQVTHNDAFAERGSRTLHLFDGALVDER